MEPASSMMRSKSPSMRWRSNVNRFDPTRRCRGRREAAGEPVVDIPDGRCERPFDLADTAGIAFGTGKRRGADVRDVARPDDATPMATTRTMVPDLRSSDTGRRWRTWSGTTPNSGTRPGRAGTVPIDGTGRATGMGSLSEFALVDLRKPVLDGRSVAGSALLGGHGGRERHRRGGRFKFTQRLPSTCRDYTGSPLSRLSLSRYSGGVRPRRIGAPIATSRPIMSRRVSKSWDSRLRTRPACR